MQTFVLLGKRVVVVVVVFCFVFFVFFYTFVQNVQTLTGTCLFSFRQILLFIAVKAFELRDGQRLHFFESPSFFVTILNTSSRTFGSAITPASKMKRPWKELRMVNA